MLSLNSTRESWITEMNNDPFYSKKLKRYKSAGWITRLINKAKLEFQKCKDWQYPILGSYGYRKFRW